MFLVTFFSTVVQTIYLFIWDFFLALINLLTFKRWRGHVTPRGTPGAGGKWPAYVAPRAGDSRSACPALNALANHGILPHDGKNIRFNELPGKVDAAFNTAPSVSMFVTNLAVAMLKKNYKRDSFDLADLDLHNGIEHDASLTREDTALVPNQSEPHLPFVKALLASASGRNRHGKALKRKDISIFSTKRRVDSRAANSAFSLDFFHKLIGSLNASFFLTILGGRVDDLQSILIEERIPEGWESRVRSRRGLTFTGSIFKVLRIEGGIDEKRYSAKLAAARPSA
ncbi:hypothetical protein M413DRAFT_446057 [Hebeloma cylindrosporum]|uniref:Heme haloperoxidase family profile domain-containing protein n=1 Tax=Hebeloma cylindrosporum TaxID=76867 RepID=A0A0C3BVK3_HEBCY|nr:hypothetical protein M413DRAFT_446057 [Hebeloma cylindrosporum h7]